MIKYLIKLPLLVSILMLSGGIWISMHYKNQASQLNGSSVDSTSINTGATAGQKRELSEEMHAVWIPFSTLDMKGTDYSREAFEKKFREIVVNCKEHGMNTVIVHVRPFGDALYPSKIFPWSHIVAGKQGIDPGYDPLEYMVKCSHAQGLKIHSWVNPFRIKAAKTPESLSDTNPCIKLKQSDELYNERVINFPQGEYYNPGSTEVHEMVVSGVEEIIKKYEVDGIHFDDYFYRATESTVVNPCYTTYLSSLPEGSAAISESDWKVANINLLISRVYRAIKAINPNIQFGISPEGNMANSKAAGADIEGWSKLPGYLDYICPQLYVSFDHAQLPFKRGVDDWRKLVTGSGTKLYYGLGLYKSGSDEDQGTWKDSSDTIKRQVEYCRGVGCDGFMFFSYDYMIDDKIKNEVQNVMSVLR